MPRASKRDAVRASASNVERPTGAGKRSTQPHPRYEPPRWPIHPAKVTIPATAPPDQMSCRTRKGVSMRHGSHSSTGARSLSSCPSPPVQLNACHAASWLGSALLMSGAMTAVAGSRATRSSQSSRAHVASDGVASTPTANRAASMSLRARAVSLALPKAAATGGRACGPSFDRAPNREAPPLRSCLMLNRHPATTLPIVRIATSTAS
ncbi:MAG: hypothetical protein QOJ46_2237 [bacterium]